MDEKDRELTPQELLKKLKESLAPQKDAPDGKGSDARDTEDDTILLRVGQSDEEEPQPQAAPTVKYRFRVSRPEAAEKQQAPADPVPSTEELLPASDTEIGFEAGSAPDVRTLMGDMLSAQEIAQMERIGGMPDAEHIALRAKEEARLAYEQSADVQPTDEAPSVTDQRLSLTDEVEAVYEGSEEYYRALDQEAEQSGGRTEDTAADGSVFHADGSITPSESSRLNAMNYITSLTKQAAESAASESSGEEQEQSPAQAEASVDGASDQDTQVDFDEVDVNLMLAFGMEEKLKDALGEEETEKLTAQADEDAKTMTSTDIFAKVSVESPKEFTDYSQTKEIFAGYKKKYRKALFSLGGGILLALLLFLLENLSVLPRALDKGYYPLVNLMVGLQLSVFCYALVFDQLKRGVSALIERKWIPEIGTVIIVGLSFIYQILMALFCRASFTTYNFPVALCMVFALAFEFMNLKREIYSFNITASKKVKYALCALSEEDSRRERDAFRAFYEPALTPVPAEGELPEQETEPAVQADEAETEGGSAPETDPFDGKPMYQLRRGAFIDGFFEKIGKYPSYKALLGLLLPAAAALSVLFLLIGAIRAGSFSYGVSTGYLALAFCAPMSMFFTYSYPLYRASRAAFRTESAIIGEQAVEEYLDAEVISFEDKDIFPAKGVKVKSIKVYGAHRIDRVVFNAANIFRKYGGPLSQVFNMATLELGTTDEVYFGTIEQDGIEAMVGGTHIYMGKTDYLRRKGYEPGFDDEDEVIEGNGGICVMFMAIEDEVAAKFYVEYTIDPEFERILRTLYTSGVCISVRTYDPNIDDRMLQLLLRYGDYPVRAIKCRTEQSENLAKEHMDSAIISRRSSMDMLRAFMSCDRVLRVIKMGSAVKIAAMAAGMIVCGIVVALAGTGVASGWAALFQLFWALPLLLVSKFTV